MPKLNISLAQMRIAYGDVKRNIAQAEKFIADAAARRSHIVVLPELWSSGMTVDNAKANASELNQGVFAQVSTWATQYKITIVGSMLEKRGLEVSNSAPIFAPNGRMMGVYRKIHLFGLMDEDKYLQPGSSSVALDMPWGVTALAICYDLRFPELFRKYSLEQNAKLIIIPAEWPLARLDHWRTLLLARAIENQCFIVACNSVGETGDTTFAGHSMIVDPWGRVVVSAGEDSQLLTGEIDLDLIDEVRKKLPALKDVRHDVY